MNVLGSVASEYRDRIVSILDQIVADQHIALRSASNAVAASLEADGLVYATGSGHSHLIAAEAFFRAGGIAAVQPIFDTPLMLHVSASQSSLAEREAGRAENIIAGYNIGRNDVIFIASNSGRNAYPIEMAMAAKARGATTIALTSMQHTQQVSSRHSSGRRLFEVTDIVLDNGAIYGDACIQVGSSNDAMAPTSTITGAFIINTVIADAVGILADRNISVDVYQSANAQGGEAKQNDLIKRWKPRIRGL